MRKKLLRALCACTVIVSPATVAQAQQAEASEDVVPDIIVTAEKREQRLNDVPQSITALTADQLEAAGVTAVRDLPRLTPGLTFADSYTGTPIYTLRGVGFVDQSLGGRPTVSVYQDEAPIPFAIETRGAFLDLERVEVLKGPQGTLFGSNSTGGLINLIAAKPTSTFEAGVQASYGRFDAWELSGFASGPISDTVGARLAVQHLGRGDWQKSYTSDATLGEQDFTVGRFTLDIRPDDRFRMVLTASGWIDKSDTQATQLIAVTPQPGPQDFIQGILTYPLAPRDSRAADWNPARDYARDNWFFQINNRIDGELSDNVTLTSITSFSRYDQDEAIDADGTRFDNSAIQTLGEIESISQELRLSARIADRANVTIGANYSHDKTDEEAVGFPIDSVLTTTAVPFGPLLTAFSVTTFQKHTNKAVFADADIELIPTLNVFGGIRYTDTDIKFSGGVKDVGDGNAAAVFGGLFSVFFGGPVIIPTGGYIVLGPTFTPEIVTGRLGEDNISWRAGLRWTPVDGKMLYASVSRGYKAGSFPNIPSLSFASYGPATQESLTAYEAGFKLSLAGRKLQLNGAAFYYDYKDKQILGRVSDDVFGALPRLVNVPESRVKGAELQLTWVPIKGLTLNAAGTYVDSKIRGDFLSPDPFDVERNYRGAGFPNAPKWQASGDVDYRFGVGANLTGILGGNVSYQSRTNSFLGNDPLLVVKDYALVDLRAGIEASDGRWRATIWGKNVFDTYYWSSTTKVSDTTVRYAGMPATYGATLSFNFR